MCMRCGKRTGILPAKGGCDCRQKREACEKAGTHGTAVSERPDAIFPDYIHRICMVCGMSLPQAKGDR